MKRADDPSQHEIAVINGASITKEEFIRRLELTPLPEFHKPGGRNKRALNLLIDELVVSQWAKGQGLEDSPGYKEAIDFVKQQAMIRELFLDRKSTRLNSSHKPISYAVFRLKKKMKKKKNDRRRTPSRHALR